jgi:hypothetical protein
VDVPLKSPDTSSLEGLVLDGYVVGAVLGSGASGLLYEAVHEASGRRAIVRVAGAEGDDARLVEVFAQEAAGLLVGEGRPVVRRATSADGRTLLLLEKVPPGRGHGEYAVTARAEATPTPPSRRTFAMVVGAALASGLAGAGALTWALATPGPTSAPLPASPPGPAVEEAPQSAPPAADSKPAPPPGAPVLQGPPPTSAVEAQPETPRAESSGPAPSPAPAAPALQPEAMKPMAEKASKAPSSRVEVERAAIPEACHNLSAWKASMKREMSALEGRAAEDDALYEALQRVPAGFGYLEVVDAAGCARVEKALDAFYAKHGLAR